MCTCVRWLARSESMVVRGEWRRPFLAGVGGCGGRDHIWLSWGSGGGHRWRGSADAVAAATHGCQGGLSVAIVGGCRWVRRPPPHMGVKWERRPPPSSVALQGKFGSCRRWRMWAAVAAAATHVCQGGLAAASIVGGVAGRLWRRPSLAGVGGCGGRRHTLGSRGSGGGRCWRVSADAAAATRHGCQGRVAAAAVGGCRRVRRPPPDTGV